MHKEKEPIIKRVALAVEMLGLSPVKLAKPLETDVRTIKRVLSGRSYPEWKLLYGLISKFEISPNWLMQGKGAMFTRYSKLNAPAQDVTDLPVEQPIRFETMLEVLACLEIWIEEAKHECFTKVERGPEVYNSTIKKLRGNNITQPIAIKAQLVIGRNTTYTINNSLKVLS